jgi:hypothetical protein
VALVSAALAATPSAAGTTAITREADMRPVEDTAGINPEACVPRRPGPPGRGTTLLLAVAMPLGPLLVAGLRAVMPTFSVPDAEATATAVAAQPDRQSLTVWLGVAAVGVLVPGVLAAAQLTRTCSPRLTSWAVGLLVPAYIYLGMLVAGDATAWSVHEAQIPPAAAARLLDTMHPAVDIAMGVFVVGHVVGTVLLGIALARSGRVPPVFGWLLAVSQPLHFVAYVVFGLRALDVLAWTLTAVAMGAAGWALLHQPAGTEAVGVSRTGVVAAGTA